MMPPFRIAHVSPDQLAAIEKLENATGLTLVAYEPAAEMDAPTQLASDFEDDSVLDALVDTYRTYDPHF